MRSRSLPRRAASSRSGQRWCAKASIRAALASATSGPCVPCRAARIHAARWSCGCRSVHTARSGRSAAGWWSRSAPSPCSATFFCTATPNEADFLIVGQAVHVSRIDVHARVAGIGTGVGQAQGASGRDRWTPPAAAGNPRPAAPPEKSRRPPAGRGRGRSRRRRAPPPAPRCPARPDTPRVTTMLLPSRALRPSVSTGGCSSSSSAGRPPAATRAWCSFCRSHASR